MDFEKNDVAVGGFVLATAAVFLAAFVAVNRAALFAKSYPLTIELSEIGGIDKGAEVMYRGYNAGQVDRVSVTYEPQFRFVVRFSVNKDIRLPEGSKVIVRGKGFTGGRYLDLIAPDGAGGAPVAPGATLPVVLDADLIAKANDVLGEAQKAVRSFREKGTADDIAALARDMRLLVADLRKSLATSEALMQENRLALKDTLARSRTMTAKADEAFDHLPALLASAEELVADLKKRPWRLVRKGGEDAPKLDHKHETPAAK